MEHDRAWVCRSLRSGGSRLPSGVPSVASTSFSNSLFYKEFGLLGVVVHSKGFVQAPVLYEY